MAIGIGSSQTLVTERNEGDQKLANEDTCNHFVKFHGETANIKGYFKCPICDKIFGHEQILQLHVQVHNTKSQNYVSQTAVKTVGISTDGNKNIEQTSPQAVYAGAKKNVGLTKIRLEDCLRCDECSCIYLDESDYKKHMKNFHRGDSPKKQRQKKGCRSCCRHCNCQGNHHDHQNVQKERGNNNLFHYNIKDRWTKMVSRRLFSTKQEAGIKPDPDYNPEHLHPDFSDLLSQVEVKIKTEPQDDPESELHVNSHS